MCLRLCKNLILLILSVSFISSCNFTKEAIYLIPEGYTGAVVILFEQPEGITLPIEDGFNVYEIPENGILKVKSSPILKIHGERFFYVKSNGDRMPIEYAYPTGSGKAWSSNPKTFDQIESDDTTIYVMGSEAGTFNTGTSKATRFRAFKIGKASDSEKLYIQTRKKIVGIQREMNF